MALAGGYWQSCGVDSGTGYMDIEEVARLMANPYHTTVFVTG